MNEFVVENWIWLLLGAFVVGYIFGRRVNNDGGGPKFKLSFQKGGNLPGSTDSNFAVKRFSDTKSTVLTSDDPLYRELTGLIDSGKKIEAIKRLREEKDLDLVAAKQFVELLESRKSMKRPS